jgi:hypothetical protein
MNRWGYCTRNFRSKEPAATSYLGENGLMEELYYVYTDVTSTVAVAHVCFLALRAGMNPEANFDHWSISREATAPKAAVARSV